MNSKYKFNYRSLIRISLILSIPMALLSSCKKDLIETVPPLAISDVNAFETPERVLAQVNGLYANLKSGQHMGGRYLIYNDIRGEEFINRLTNGVTGLQTWNHTLNSGTNEVENLWGSAYATINRINVFLKGLDDNSSKINATLLPQYKAEAKFLRGLCYYNLVVLYAKPFTMSNGSNPGLPLRLQAETGAENNDLARSTVAEVYNQILKDLDDAESGLPLTYATALLNTTRAHKNTAIALKTRVKLAKGDYAGVVTEAAKIVSTTSPYKATTGVANQMQASVVTPFTNFITPESVLSMPMTDANAPGTQNQLGYYYNVPGVGNGEYYLNPAGILGNTEWTSTDQRKVNFLAVAGGNTYVKKFNKSAPYSDYVPVIRYPEVLLNYAEAAARTNDLPKAVSLLTAVRNRSDASYVFPAASITIQANLINTILAERRIELLAEGFRSMDLLRTGQSLPAKPGVNAIASTQTEYIWPIPTSEIQTNKLITPN